MKDVAIIVVIALVAAGLSTAIFFAVRRKDAEGPPPCEWYADFPRERVPARCFDDFKRDRP